MSLASHVEALMRRVAEAAGALATIGSPEALAA
jgi:hypothetical protein